LISAISARDELRFMLTKGQVAAQRGHHQRMVDQPTFKPGVLCQLGLTFGPTNRQ
jgi:hypothetical protein